MKNSNKSLLTLIKLNEMKTLSKNTLTPSRSYLALEATQLKAPEKRKAAMAP